MIRWRKLRYLLKDRLALLTSSSPVVSSVLRATSSFPAESPPSDPCLSAMILLGSGSRLSASSGVSCLLGRLRSPDAHIVLKSLLSLHVIVSRGTFILHDQLLSSSLDGRSRLNLSGFRDHSDPSTWRLSSLARWYASFLESVLAASRSLSCFYTSASHQQNRKVHGRFADERVLGLGNSELLREVDALGDVLQGACEMPFTSGCDLVCEIARMVVEDYGATRREILTRVHEIADRIDMLLTDNNDGHDVDVDWLQKVLERLGESEGKALGVFGNKRNNDGLWEVVRCATRKVLDAKQKRQARKSIVKFDESSRIQVVGDKPRWSYGSGIRFNGGGGGGDAFIRHDLGPITVLAA